MRTISEVLDRVKKVQKVTSDYKLSLCLGIGESSLSAYRKGVNLPDEKTCQKLAVAMGEDPIILMVEMHAQRVKDDDSRAMWSALARRLQTGFSSLSFSVMLAIVAIAASALPVSASPVSVSSESSPTVYYVKQAKAAFSFIFRKIVIFGNEVSFLGFRGNNCAL